jgi:hypothetical protein
MSEKITLSDAQQKSLRELDDASTKIQRDLGALELDYVTAKSQILMTFEHNRAEYRKRVEALAAEYAIDTKTGSWVFDMSKMSFIPKT